MHSEVIMDSDLTINDLSERMLLKVCENGVVKARKITSDRDGAAWLLSACKFSQLLQGYEGDLFTTKARRGGFSVVKNSCTLGMPDMFVSLVKHAPRYIKKTFPFHDFDPAVDLLFQIMHSKTSVVQIVEILGLEFSSVLANELRDDLNGFVRHYQEIISSASFKALARRRKRAARKNYWRISNLLDELLAYRSRLLVVRVDLYYPSVFVDAGLTGRAVTPEVVAQHRAEFIREVERLPVSKHLLDFAWKMEFTERKGFHFHWLFFFDGAKTRKGIVLGRCLGEIWQKILGCQKVYWNCNAAMDKYEELGIGMVSRRDKERLCGLDMAAEYLTKPDYYLALSNEAVGDTFGTWPKGKKIRERKVVNYSSLKSGEVEGIGLTMLPMPFR